MKALEPENTPSPAQCDAWLAALAEDSIGLLTTPAIVARGRQILASGAIEALDLALPSVQQAVLRATVVGTQPYRVSLTLYGPPSRVALQSDCTCPHAEDGWFCKHQVALALWWRADLSGEAVAVEPAAAKQPAARRQRAATAAAQVSALRGFLARQPAEVLAERLMQFATLLPDVKRELQVWQATAESAGDARSVSKLVTQLLPLRDFLDWRDSAAYARQAAQVLPLLTDALQAQPPAEALKLVERTYLRLQKQLHDADDSGGQLGGICADVGGLWLQALQRAGTQPAAFGDRYAELRDAECCDFIPHGDALAAMGEAAARRFGERLRSAFEAAAARATPATSRDAFGGSSALWSARHDYLCHLSACGDVDERLRVLRTALETASDHLALVNELDRLGRVREAVDGAERAYRLYPQDESIERRLLALYERDGWDAEALAVRQAGFARRPHAQAALAVLAAARRARQDPEPLRRRMWQALIDDEDAQSKRQRQPRNVSERLAWLREEGRLDEALALAQPPHAASMQALEALAAALPPAHDTAAAALLRRVFEASMRQASSPYTHELRLVRLVMARLPPGEAAAWRSQLRVDYRAKRNFIRDLP